jgi:hypothetical protein
MAADQRYCLNCGHRRGDPRLPFMDAVVFMESMSAPGGGGTVTPPPPPARPEGNNRWNANAALIAGVATLVLAIGVGFLIGRSGHDNAPQAAAPQVVKIEGGSGGGGEEAAPATPEESTGGGHEKSGSKGNGAKKSTGKKSVAEKTKIKEGSKQEEELAAEETQKVLHSKEKLLKPKTQLGDACEEGTAGCTNGKFEGNFFE